MAEALHHPDGPGLSSDYKPFPLQEYLGFSMETVGIGQVRAVIEIGPSALNPNGVVHGAVFFALADSAMGAATTSVIDDDMACASIDVHMRFLRPVTEGVLTADAVVLRAGKRVVQLEARITDGNDRQVAMATGSFGVCPKKPLV